MDKIDEMMVADAEQGIIAVNGSVPGAKGSYVYISDSIYITLQVDGTLYNYWTISDFTNLYTYDLWIFIYEFLCIIRSKFFENF